MNCLLCGSKHISVKESYSKEELAALWVGYFPAIYTELKLDKVEVFQCSHCGLRFFDPRLAGGDEFYSELGKLDWYYLHAGKTEYDYVQKYIKQNDKILDIGAGRGVLFTKIKPRVDYTGLELSSKAVELAQSENIHVIKEDLLKHAPRHSGYYDLVCLFQVLEHLTELDGFLKSVRNTLKPQGLFVIAVPDNDGFISHTPNYTFNLPPHHIILWTEKSLRFLSEKYDFEVVEIKRELLQDVHRDIVYKSYLISLFKKFKSLPHLLIDKSKEHQDIAHKIDGLYGGRRFNKFIMPLVRWRKKYGQSIIVTLRKK